jgi:hypothetical protein
LDDRGDDPRVTSPPEIKDEYRLSGGMLVAIGSVMTYWAWREARAGEYAMTPAVLGPTLLALGAGLLVHGTGIAIAGINTRSRVYGLAGVAGTVALLAAHGFFSRPADHRWLWWAHSALPFALAVYWLLPAHMLGGRPRDPLGPALAAAEAERAARARPVHGSGASSSGAGAPSRNPATSSTGTRRDRL